jgi:hypothetical protein
MARMFGQGPGARGGCNVTIRRADARNVQHEAGTVNSWKALPKRQLTSNGLHVVTYILRFSRFSRDAVSLL